MRSLKMSAICFHTPLPSYGLLRRSLDTLVMTRVTYAQPAQNRFFNQLISTISHLLRLLGTSHNLGFSTVLLDFNRDSI
jgi:hypothetical protein